MDSDDLREEELAKVRREAALRAGAEVAGLEKRYGGGAAYTFEYKGKPIRSMFVSARVTGRLPNSYSIVVRAPSDTAIDGQCWITDLHGKKVGAVAITTQGSTNLVTLETLAVR